MSPSSPLGLSGLPSRTAVTKASSSPAIGLGIALEEEGQRRIGGVAVAIGAGDGGGVTVAGGEQSLRAMHLDALVVAIGGAARIGDLGDPAGRGLEQHGGGIDVAGLADGRIDQIGADGMDLDRLLAEQEARHVEIVDHHVAIETAGALDIAHRRRAGIARQDGDQLDAAGLAGRDAAVHIGEARIEAAVEADHQLALGRGDDLQAGLDARRIEADRLLAEDGLAGLDGALDEIGMGVGRRADGNRTDRLVVHDRIDRRHPGAGRRGQRLRRLGIGIGDCGERCTRVVGNVSPVDLADPPGPEKRHRQHVT